MNLRLLKVDGSIHSENDADLHFTATNCQGKVLAGLSWRRNHAKLLQQTRVVIVAPEFDALAIGEAGDGDSCRHHLFARGCNAHEVALLGATKRVASYDAVSFSDDVLNSETGIGEGAEVEREELFEGFEPLHRRGGIVRHQVRSIHLI